MSHFNTTTQTGFARSASEAMFPALFPTDGWWCPSLNPAMGGTRLWDLSRGQNWGTLTNMANDDWVISGGKGALDFDGSNDVVAISGSTIYAANASPFSVSLFAHVRNFTNVYTKFLMLRSDDTSAWEFGVSSDANNFRGILFGTSNAWARNRADLTTAVMTSGWHHYALSYNGNGRGTAGNFSVYFNGVLQTTTGAGSFSATTNTSSICLNAANNRLNGQIDDIRIYNRALTAGEVRQLYNVGRGNMPLRRRRRYTQQAAGGNRRRRVLLGAEC
jgi:hypothetical protein